MEAKAMEKISKAVGFVVAGVLFAGEAASLVMEQDFNMIPAPVVEHDNNRASDPMIVEHDRNQASVYPIVEHDHNQA
jgi:hypothetical protein